MTLRNLTHDVVDADDGPHEPGTGAPDNWQESSAICWYDPLSRIGGWQHLALQRPRARSDYSSSVVFQGRQVGGDDAASAAYPADDFPDVHVGPIHLRTKVPLRAYTVTADYPDAVCEAEYVAYESPVAYEVPGTVFSVGHFETMGRIDGTLTLSGDTIPFSTSFAIHDHSWGPRNYGELLTYRNYVAGFGPDLFLDIGVTWSPSGRQLFGFVFDDGDWNVVEQINSTVVIGDDGYSPQSADVRVWTDSGRAYHMTGTADGVYPHTHRDDYLNTVAYLRAEIGGRIGGGLVCLRDVGSASQWSRLQEHRRDRR